MANGDNKYRSRKWILVCWIELFATIVTAWFLLKAEDPMPFLWWWTTVSGTNLGGYGVINLTDKKMNGNGS